MVGNDLHLEQEGRNPNYTGTPTPTMAGGMAEQQRHAVVILTILEHRLLPYPLSKPVLESEAQDTTNNQKNNFVGDFSEINIQLTDIAK